MALATTTLSSAVAVTDNSIVVASAASIAVGRIIIVDGEQMQVQKAWSSGTTIPVTRGIGGTVTAAHPITSNVTHGDAADFTAPGPGNSPINWPNVRSRVVKSYTADGAITLPTDGTDMVALLNGTTQWDMTLAAPTKDLDGCVLTIIGNGKAAHTVTITAGIGNAGSGYTVLTFDTGGQCCVNLMAANGVWVPLPSPMSGTLTAVDVAVA
jgi:hypothetical protein